MSISNTTKINALFKSLLGREHTANEKTWYEEFSATTKILHRTEILLDTIPPDPPAEETKAIKKLSKYTLTEILTVPGHKAWKILEDPNDSNSSNLRNLVHPRFGQGYNVKIYDANDNEIPPTSEVGWLFFYEPGVLIFENDPTQYGYSLPLKIDGYRYVGKVLAPQQTNNPSISSVEWNNSTHYESSTYDLTIIASDPKGLSLSYQVTCPNSDVTIVQDTVDPNIFHVTYPTLTSDTIVTYTVTVTNSVGASDTEVITSTVYHNESSSLVPIINTVSWDAITFYENDSYTLTIDASDPNNQNLSYQVTCDTIDVTIDQDGVNPNIFYITYPIFDESILVGYTIKVTNEDNLSATRETSVLVKKVSDKNSPVINNVVFDSTTFNADNSYSLSIDASDPNGLDLTYEVTCDDFNVAIQSQVDGNVFEVSFPPYTDYKLCFFKITVTNDIGVKSTAFFNTFVHPILPPNIENIRWNSQTHYPKKTYMMLIEASDPQGQNLTYEVTCDDPNVIMDQNSNFVMITYPDYGSNKIVTFNIKVSNSYLYSRHYENRIVNVPIYNRVPYINSINWNNELHTRGGIYTLTVNAADPFDEALSYELQVREEADSHPENEHIEIDIPDPDNSPNVFLITYPFYYRDFVIVDFIITVTNTSGFKTTFTIPKVVNSNRGPYINGVKWNSNIHMENASYSLSIDAMDPLLKSLNYQVTCNDPNVTISQQSGDSKNVFNITYPEYQDSTVITFTVTVSNPAGNSVSYTFSKTVYNNLSVLPPVIAETTWNTEDQYEQNTYDLTITANDPQSNPITYQVSCDDANVTIVQDTTDPNIFHVTYPDLVNDTWMFFTITVNCDTTQLDTVKILPIKVKYDPGGVPPVISNIQWNNNNHIEQNTYDMIITAYDPYLLPLTYQVTCNDPYVTITQDTIDPNVFHITYPDLSHESIVVFDVTVSNSIPLSTKYRDIKHVYLYKKPEVSIGWNNTNHIEQHSYELTITANDPNIPPTSLTYQVSCNDTNVTITQDGTDPTIFHITYPDYTNPVEVIYSISVSDSIGNTTIVKDQRVISVFKDPIIRNALWNYSDHHATVTYDLTIDAIDLNELDLTYQVSCDDANVTIVQDTTNPNVFHITYPDYTSDTDVTFTITVINSDGLDAIVKITKTVDPDHSLLPPVINELSWNETDFYTLTEYILTIDAIDPQNHSLTYQVSCDDTSVTITQDTTNSNVFHISYPEFYIDTNVTFTITVTNSDGLNVTTNTTEFVNLWPKPIIDIINWDTAPHFVGKSYELSIAAHDPNGLPLTYTLLPDIDEVTVVDNGGGSYTVTYPNWPDETIVNYTALVTNSKGAELSHIFTSVVNIPPKSILDSISWNKAIHYEQNTYELYINVHDKYFGNQNNWDNDSLSCNDPNVNIVQGTDSDYHTFYVTYPNYNKDTILTFTLTINNGETDSIYRFKKLVNCYKAPIIDGLVWDNNDQYEQKTYHLTVTAHDPNDIPLNIDTYSLVCDDNNIIITQDTNDPTKFTVTYPDYEFDTFIAFRASVSNGIPQLGFRDIVQLVKSQKSPLITGYSWNIDNQFEAGTYQITIDASDPNKLDLTYEISCSDTNVTIIQDTTDPNIFTVTYPNYTNDTTVTYTITVTNTDGLDAVKNIDVLVHDTNIPVINDITWDSVNQKELHSYVMTIDAFDANGLNLTYEVVCDDINVIITQDTNDPTKFTVTYPNYTNDITIVNYTITVTNTNSYSTSRVETMDVHKFGFPPIIDSYTWSSSNIYEQETYNLTIDAHDPDNATISYQLEFNDPNVAVVQDGTDNNIFHITFPDYDEVTTVTYTITVTNISGKSSHVNDSVAVLSYPPPEITNIVFNEASLYEFDTYVATIYGESPNAFPLVYELICDDVNVTIEQDLGNPSNFNVTFPSYDAITKVTFVGKITDSKSSTDQAKVEKIINLYPRPIIDDIVWNEDAHYIGNTYDLTITAQSGDSNLSVIGYQVTCDDSNVTIEQDGLDPNVFHVTYPDYTTPRNVIFTITVENSKFETKSMTTSKTVNLHATPSITSVVISQSTEPGYDIDINITANDPEGSPLVYSVTCDTPSTQIDQDINDPTIFHVNYIDFGQTQLIVNFFVTVTNEYQLSDRDTITHQAGSLNQTGIFGGGTGPSNKKSIEYITINTPGNSQSFGYLVQGIVYGCADSNGFKGDALAPGGIPDSWKQKEYSPTNNVEHIRLDYPTNGQLWSTLTYPRSAASACSNRSNDRLICAGGFNKDYGSAADRNIRHIEYFTLSIQSGSNMFGLLDIEGRDYCTGVSNAENDRGVIIGGHYWSWGTSDHNISSMSYVTISTPSNSIHFGYLDPSPYYSTNVTSVSNGIFDKAVLFSGQHAVGGGEQTNKIRHINISTPGNSQSFGYLLHATSNGGGVSNYTDSRGVFMSGLSYSTDIEYVTIGVPSNSTLFGQLLSGRASRISTSNS